MLLVMVGTDVNGESLCFTKTWDVVLVSGNCGNRCCLSGDCCSCHGDCCQGDSIVCGEEA